jgi:Flp pilus assembly pilin Flp
MRNSLHKLATLLADEHGQDIAEYAVMLAVILVLVVGTIRLVGSNANNAFSQAAIRFNRAAASRCPNRPRRFALL